jgi:hypothetical protein
MVYRKRRFTEINGEKLLEAAKTFSKAVFEADQNAPFGSEIHRVLQKLTMAVRVVQRTVTGDRQYGVCQSGGIAQRIAGPLVEDESLVCFIPRAHRYVTMSGV